MKIFKLMMLVSGLIVFTLTGCEKGDTGPIGPEGEQGVQGEKGDKGDKGDRGETGATGPRGATGAKGDKGDVGATGPRGATGAQGPAGPRGATGAKGDKGDDGNANVVLYEFGSRTFTNSLDLDLFVSRALVDNSMVLVYYNPSNEVETAWFASPGLGSSAKYQTRYFIYQNSTSPSVYRLGIRAIKPDVFEEYGLPLTFRKIKVIFAEASTILSAQASGQLDLENYQSVKQALRIQD